MNYDLILVNGAPGIGKTTLCELLGIHFESPVIDFGLLREFHLDKRWERKSDAEEEMTFKILKQMLNTYIEHGLKNIFINDLQEWRIDLLRKAYAHTNSLVLTLYVTDYEILKDRIVTRNKGWRDVEASWKRHQNTLAREPWPNEIRVDVTVDGIDNALKIVRKAIQLTDHETLDTA